jgi:tripartite-type tricarboxylate transporter receptor subunit TctC
MLGDGLKGILGESIVIETMPGASGMRGAEAVAHAEPNGYTLLLSCAGEVAVNPHLFKNIKYDPSCDLLHRQGVRTADEYRLGGEWRQNPAILHARSDWSLIVRRERG